MSFAMIFVVYLLTVEVFNCCLSQNLQNLQNRFLFMEACQPAASCGKAVAMPLKHERSFACFVGFVIK